MKQRYRFGPFEVRPAERLMVRLRENFSGELIEYVIEPAEPGAGPPADA